MNTSIQTVIDSLAAIAEADAQVIRSSNGRHISSGIVVGKPTANRVSVSDGESRPKAVKEAFKRDAALTTLCDACDGFKVAIAAARAVLAAAAKDADKVRRAATVKA